MCFDIDVCVHCCRSTKVGAIKMDASEPTMKKHVLESTSSNTALADKKNSKKVLKRL